MVELRHLIMSDKKYKASEMVKFTEALQGERPKIEGGPVASGPVTYGKPNHIPMRGWLDYTVVPTEEVDTEA
jgi:hypothetical protein